MNIQNADGKKTLKITAAELSKIAMPIPFSDERRQQLHRTRVQRPALEEGADPIDTEERISFDPVKTDYMGQEGIPGYGKRRMRAVAPDMPETQDRALPSFGRYRPSDIRTIDGQRYIVQDYWRNSKGEPTAQYGSENKARGALKNLPDEATRNITPTGFFPGWVKLFNVDTGIQEFKTWVEVEPVLTEAARQQQFETTRRYNAAAASFNERLRRLPAATKDLTVLPPQLLQYEEQLNERIQFLNNSIQEAEAKLGAETPEAIQQINADIDARIQAQDLEIGDFLDSIFHRYMYRYDRLAEAVRQGQIPMPRSTQDPERLRQVIIRMAEEAYGEHRMEQLADQYSAHGGPGVNPLQQLADDLQAGRVAIPAVIGPEVRTWMQEKANGLAAGWRERARFDLGRQRLVGELPLIPEGGLPSKHRISGYHSWESSQSSLRAQLISQKRDRDELQVIANGLNHIQDVIRALPPGTRGSTHLNTPAGQRILDEIEQIAGTEMRRFMERYSPETILPSGHLDYKKLVGRMGSIGNSFIAITLTRAYKILATTLNNYRPNALPLPPEEEGRPAERTPQPTTTPPTGSPAPASTPEGTGKSSSAQSVKITRSMWEKIGQKAGWMKTAGKSKDGKPITPYEGSWADKQGKEPLPKNPQHPTHSEEQKLMDAKKRVKCKLCGGDKPHDQSCLCFDNGCQ